MRLVVLFLFYLVFTSCQPKPIPTSIALEDIPLIPLPNNVLGKDSIGIQINNDFVLQLEKDDAGLNQIGLQLQGIINTFTNVKPRIKIGEVKGQRILLSDNLKSDNKEAYRIEITNKEIVLAGASVEGVYRGIQTLRQVFELLKSEGPIGRLPLGLIEDAPTFQHRGSMLDVSRHFFDVMAVKRYLDNLSHYKINVLHLHLADDQGWRIEIKKWPKLTTIGGSTEVGGGKGGYYTQEQYKEIVDYAAERFITIIPELDMPGHTNAALASYPELNCDQKARSLYTGTAVGFSTLCTRLPIVDTFVNDVIKELSALTPGPYIHIGGDESDATKEADYKAFITRVQAIVNQNGKQMIGWDDIAAGSLNSTTVAQHWAKAENALAAQEQDVSIIMSPAKKAYLDMQYDSTSRIGLHWAAYIEVDEAYNWEPSSYIEGINTSMILGVEAPLWTETVQTMDDLEYLAFPRILGYSEIGWTHSSKRDWEAYKERLAQHQPVMDAKGINFYRSPKVPWKKLEG